MSRKVLLLITMLLIVTITSIMATESRITSLGNPSGFIRDNTDIFYYPATIFNYSNRIDLELRGEGNIGDWSIGVNLPMYKNVLGVYLNRSTGFDIDDYFYTDYKHSDYDWNDLNIRKKIQFLYGFKEKYGIGLGMSIDNNTTPVGADVTKNVTMSAKYFELLGGISD